jgi:hypothetical protein
MESESIRELQITRSTDTLDLKPLYVGAQEYERLMDKLKKKKKDTFGRGT